MKQTGERCSWSASVRKRPAAMFKLRSRRRSEEHTSELQSQSKLGCRLLLEKKKQRVTSGYLRLFTSSSNAFVVQSVKRDCCRPNTCDVCYRRSSESYTTTCDGSSRETSTT